MVSISWSLIACPAGLDKTSDTLQPGNRFMSIGGSYTNKHRHTHIYYFLLRQAREILITNFFLISKRIISEKCLDQIDQRAESHLNCINVKRKLSEINHKIWIVPIHCFSLSECILWEKNTVFTWGLIYPQYIGEKNYLYSNTVITALQQYLEIDVDEKVIHCISRPKCVSGSGRWDEALTSSLVGSRMSMQMKSCLARFKFRSFRKAFDLFS